MYVINLNHKNGKGTHQVSLFFDRNIAIYWDPFGIEYIPLEVLSKIRDKSNIFRVQDHGSIVCRFSCIDFIE